jgi:peptidoglycan hydrolase-like protein with peptidoglycan-binding domain
MFARRFGVRAVLLGLVGPAFIGTVATAGAATAAAESDGCGGASAAFATTLRQVRPGNSGTYVMGLQKALAIEGYPLRGTGYYGSNTLAAVRDFQAKHGIKNSGIVGPKTWQALVGTKPTCATLNGKPDTPTFGMLPGDRDLSHLDALLIRLYRVYPDEAALVADRSYTPAFQALVKKFQRANGIKASGIVGPKTWRALNLVISISGRWPCGC